jgi:thiamine biosynthesis lipoprotein
MGTRYSAVFFAAPGLDQQAIGAALFGAVHQVDRQMSTWKPDSDLSRLNAAPEQQWLTAPAELLEVLETALDMSEKSDGAFDIGVGALVDAWGFGPATQQPAPQQIDVLRKQAYRPAAAALDIDRLQNRVRKRAAIKLDLSGIAKGYGVDELARCLDECGIRSYLVGIDGEMRARGLKPDGQCWAVAIEKPVAGRREVMGVMELTDLAIATSGDYRHSVELAGQRYSHTINPALREPVRNQLAAVTVLASSCMLADAWATALLVSGDVLGAELARKHGLDALFVLRDGSGFEEISIVGGQLCAPAI